MTSYVAINNNEIDPESPITTGLMTKLRDNPIAAFEGAAGAPRLSRAAIHPGGSGADGDYTSGSGNLTDPGWYDYLSLSVPGSKSFPWYSVVRVAGNASITGTLSLARAYAAEHGMASWLDLIKGNAGAGDDGSGGSAGGGSIGRGGAGNVAATLPGGAAQAFTPTALRRKFLIPRPILGGHSGNENLTYGIRGGGGVLILVVHGDLDMNGGTIDASGQNGALDGGRSPGAGAGGSIIVVCTGTITGGTFNAKGGDTWESGAQMGGGGGGGLVLLAAAAYAGVQTKNVAAGQCFGGGANFQGTIGYSAQETLTEAAINSLMLG